MKIALPSRNNNIDDHFGHCEYYTLFTVDTQSKKITDTEILQSPEGCGCKSNIASTLYDKGVKVMLAGNIGEGAVRVLNNAGIEVLRGCSGDVKTVASKWLEGSILDSGELCHAHDCNN
ncbi:NifB/NifX family molybdenum-iron cluster-binding protein [uncultured Clostridium sp.]|uniref:NifB/NifX family molybdenum-iron cluster-binding protein n=1 Tax=uncultured Clostridium sp. TaxID=59620 RepID=UPI0028ECF16A|nr:NifB/NifX family molybdenum-iron cluster-binding protein [uncultured Clostridium sp.]